MGLSHQDLSRKALSSLLPRDSSLVPLSPPLSGIDENDAGRRRLMINRCLCSPSSVPSIHVSHSIFLSTCSLSYAERVSERHWREGEKGVCRSSVTDGVEVTLARKLKNSYQLNERASVKNR